MATLFSGVVVRVDEWYLLQALTIFWLSLWKTYIGPLMAAGLGFSYWEMMLYNISAALSSSLIVLYASDIYFARRKSNPKGFNRKLRQALGYWKKYGKWVALTLAPVLLGIPTYVFIARRLKERRRIIMLEIGAITSAWCTLIYFAGKQGIIAVQAFL